MNPEPQTPVSQEEAVAPRWMHKLAAVVFCIFCLELGVFLLVYPWLGHLWDRNWFLRLRPDWEPFLLSQQFRGAISGLGVLNLIIAFIEIFRLRRFAGH